MSKIIYGFSEIAYSLGSVSAPLFVIGFTPAVLQRYAQMKKWKIGGYSPGTLTHTSTILAVILRPLLD